MSLLSTPLLCILLWQEPTVHHRLALLEGVTFSADEAMEVQNELKGLTADEQLQLAQAYQWGRGGVIKNHKMAAAVFQWITTSDPSHSHYDESQYRIGWMYLYALGVPMDTTQAIQRLKLAAEAGSSYALIELGWLSEIGRGMPQSSPGAILYFQKAAKMGSQQAIWLLETLAQPKVTEPIMTGNKFRESLTGMIFRRLPPGDFLRKVIHPQEHAFPTPQPHRVLISKPFLIGQFEVTQGAWLRVMGGDLAYYSNCGDSCPVVGINWHQVQAFIRRLNRLSPQSGFRLPTEAEWEFACRAGTTTAYHRGDALQQDHANVDHRFGEDGDLGQAVAGQPVPVGNYPANAWGLHDMHGNVLEWCQDDFCPLGGARQRDPLERCRSNFKVIRGGSWFFGPQVAKSGYRDFHRPQDLGRSLGFRLVKDVSVTDQ